MKAKPPLKAKRPDVRAEGAGRAAAGVQRELVRLQDLHPPAPFVAFTARNARLLAPCRPYNRAQNEVRTSILSRTTSFPVSPSFAATMRRPRAASAASRCSTPKRASRSLCSTRLADTHRSASRSRNLRRWPFRPEPTSVTHAVTLATCRSKSAPLVVGNPCIHDAPSCGHLGREIHQNAP